MTSFDFHDFPGKSIGFLERSFDFLVRSFGFGVRSFVFLVRSFGFPVVSFGFPVESFGSLLRSFGFLVRSFEFQVRSFSFLVRSFGFLVYPKGINNHGFLISFSQYVGEGIRNTSGHIIDARDKLVVRLFPIVDNFSRNEKKHFTIFFSNITPKLQASVFGSRNQSFLQVIFQDLTKHRYLRS